MEGRKKWLDAVEKFRTDINSIIKCLHCEKGFSIIKDVFPDEGNTIVILTKTN